MDISERHKAQASLPQITEAGQRRLYEANVLIIGVGALGSAVAELLCRAGVRNMTLYDYDIIDETNLQRQSLYTTLDLGKFKVETAKERLIEIDPHCLVKCVNEAFSPKTNVSEYDIIIDGTDSLQARLLLNDAAKKAGKPLVIGTAAATVGLVFVARDDVCWQCLTLGKSAADDCGSGVLGATIYTVASAQATAAIQTMLGAIPKELVEIDTWNASTRKIAVTRNHECAACRGEYRHLQAQFILRFCAARERLVATPSIPQLIDLDGLRSSQQVLKDYGSALLLALGDGQVLVHRHGALEFTNIEEEAAKRFAGTLH